MMNDEKKLCALVITCPLWQINFIENFACPNPVF
jgi:hypothetical protein